LFAVDIKQVFIIKDFNFAQNLCNNLDKNVSRMEFHYYTNDETLKIKLNVHNITEILYLEERNHKIEVDLEKKQLVLVKFPFITFISYHCL
jgi:hypothetical protein